MAWNDPKSAGSFQAPREYGWLNRDFALVRHAEFDATDLLRNASTPVGANSPKVHTMGKLVGIREAARQLGVNASTISRQVAAGVIPNHGGDGSPLVDPEEARSARQLNLDPSKRRGVGSPLSLHPTPQDITSSPRGSGYQVSRAEREGYDAALKRIELEERLRNLLDKGEVTEAAFAIGQVLREMIERRQPTLAARLAGVIDVGTIAAILVEEDRRLLEAIGDEMQRKFVSSSRPQTGASS